MLKTETVGPYLVGKLKWWGHGPTAPHNGYTPVKKVHLFEIFISGANLAKASIFLLIFLINSEKWYPKLHIIKFNSQ